MIAAWMLWSIGSGLLLLGAGLAAEKLFEGRRRWVWLAAGAGTVLLAGARLVASGGGATEPENPAGAFAPTASTATLTSPGGAREGSGAAPGTLAEPPRVPLLPVAIPHDSVLHSFDRVLLLAWPALSAGLALWALIGALRLHRRRRSWEPGTLLGQPILWSRNTGPAIVGLRRPSVVLPSWVGDVEPSQQKLILAHEEEHRRAGDGVLRFAIATLLVAVPWNPFLWLHYRRLCLAIELDCDHRVVKRLPDQRWMYGDLLVRVGARNGFLPGFAPTAFAERRSFLERRIGRLLSEDPEAGVARMAFLAFAAVLVAGVALWAPGVTEEEAGPEVPIPGASVDWVVSGDGGQLGVPIPSYHFGVEGPRWWSGWTFEHELFEGRQGGLVRWKTGLGWYSPARIWRLAGDMRKTESGWSFEPAPVAGGPTPFAGHGTVLEAPPTEEGTDLQVWEGEPDHPLPVVSLPVAPSPYLAAYEVPPVSPDASVMERPQFVDHTLRPELANRWEVRTTLAHEYPTDLKDAGIGGVAVVYVFVNTDGSVSEAVMKTSTGHEALDRAALRAARRARFLPASIEGVPVGIWIEMQVPFSP